MSDKQMKRNFALAVGAALASSLAVASVAQGSTPFTMTSLASGYMAAGEGSCGADKKKAEGSCGADKKEAEGSCGGDKKEAEGSCGGDKDAEGKCGEGKCGGTI
jgi:uncharacterized low-complexity protein